MRTGAKGITELMRIFPDLQLIVLDDSFQHRWVKPKVSVLLTDYSRPFYKDRLLPLGELRESPAQVNRADMVVVTKCPDDLMPISFRIATKDLDLMKFRKLFFSRYEYGHFTLAKPETLAGTTLFVGRFPISSHKDTNYLANST